jgi:hypothetical protein
MQWYIIVYMCVTWLMFLSYFKLFYMIWINHGVTQRIDGVTQSYVVVEFVVGSFVHMLIYLQD